MPARMLLTIASRLGLAALGTCAVIALSTGASVAQSGAAPAPAPDAAKLSKGKDLFNNYGCGSCHSLADAGASGHVGPAFDGDSNLSEAFVIDRVSNGQGVMPAFGGQMSPEEIAAVAAYINHAAQK